LRLVSEDAVDAGNAQQFCHHKNNLKPPDIRSCRTYRQRWSTVLDPSSPKEHATISLTYHGLKSNRRYGRQSHQDNREISTPDKPGQTQLIRSDQETVEPFAIMLPRGDWAFRLAVNTALATKYLGGVGLGFSNWAGVVFMFGGLPE
jgi:hypothetical protein